MDKYYVQNSTTKLVCVAENPEEAAIKMAKKIHIEGLPLSLLTSVHISGFMNDLLEGKMDNELDDGLIFLTSWAFNKLIERTDEDSDEWLELMEISTKIIEMETESIENGGKEADIISDFDE